MAAYTLSLPGGYTNLTGGPVDEWYYFRINDSSTRPYNTKAEACARIPFAHRSGRTVSILGVEYWWLYSDVTDTGLVLKTATASGGGHKLFDKNNTAIPDSVTEVQFLGDTTVAGNRLTVAPGAATGGGDVTAAQLEAVRADLQSKLNAINAIIGSTDPDANNVIDTVREVLALLANYPESPTLLTTLNALTASVTLAAKGANLFVFQTRAEMNGDVTWRAGGRKAAVWKDSEANNGDYYIAADGYTIVKKTASTSEVVGSFELLTGSTDVKAGRIYRYTIAPAERLWLAKVDQAPGSVFFPVDADKTAPGGTYWVEQSPSVATTQNGVAGENIPVITPQVGTTVDFHPNTRLQTRSHPGFPTALILDTFVNARLGRRVTIKIASSDNQNYVRIGLVNLGAPNTATWATSINLGADLATTPTLCTFNDRGLVFLGNYPNTLDLEMVGPAEFNLYNTPG
jgi:hypothetical protein